MHCSRHFVKKQNNEKINLMKLTYLLYLFPYKKYFSLFDMRSILKSNIDYIISSEFFLKNYDEYVMNGNIITLEPKMPNIFAKDFSVFMTIAADMTKERETDEYEEE